MENMAWRMWHGEYGMENMAWRIWHGEYGMENMAMVSEGELAITSI